MLVLNGAPHTMLPALARKSEAVKEKKMAAYSNKPMLS